MTIHKNSQSKVSPCWTCNIAKFTSVIFDSAYSPNLHWSQNYKASRPMCGGFVHADSNMWLFAARMNFISNVSVQRPLLHITCWRTLCQIIVIKIHSWLQMRWAVCRSFHPDFVCPWSDSMHHAQVCKSFTLCYCFGHNNLSWSTEACLYDMIDTLPHERT